MTKEKQVFQKLTPIDDVELDGYEDAINYVFEQNDILNIAISGPYSAGKSSVIETYRKKHKNRRFIHISLSYFESLSEENVDGLRGEEKSDKPDKFILEGKILNQLIHQSEPEKIQQSNFKLKRSIPKEKMVKSTMTFILFILLSSYILFFANWDSFVSSLTFSWIKSMLQWTLHPDLLLLSGLLCTGIFGKAVYTIIKKQKNKNIFKKLSFQGNEIEIFEENEDSYFDKYLNEVLYLFEKSDADVIVFEDMDRYNVDQIFGKLREINTLINYKRKSNKNQGKTPLRFFYLLRDDIFVSKDRTKFFDFIMPVVPVLDGSNSYDQFISHFKQGGILKSFNSEFLQGLSLYIDDMRILKNIYNEFIIYNNRIQSIEISSDKLLAIIAYKNIFPKDFSDLQLGQGFIHTLFEKKEEYAEQDILKIDKQINNMEEKINLINNEVFDFIEELEAAYLLMNYEIRKIGNSDLSRYKTRVEVLKAMKDNPEKVYYYRINYGQSRLDVISELEKLNEIPAYSKRKKNVEKKGVDETRKLKRNIERLINRKMVIENNKMKDIITKENIEDFFSETHINEIGIENKFEEIKSDPNFPLIKYLMRNGYIDETYSDYMTYFYENSLSRIDKNFLLSITDQIAKEYSYSLKNPKLILSRVKFVDFDYPEILNYDLLCYLLKREAKHEKYLIRFLRQLERTDNFEFIGGFLKTAREKELFVKTINNTWPDIIYKILNESNWSHEQKKEYIIYTFYYSSESDINMLNKKDCLTDFISDCADFLDIEKPNINKLISGFSLVNVKFSLLDFEVSNHELFEAVYNENLYQLNFDFISLILEKVYRLTKNNDFNNKNYTLINKMEEQPLYQYVNDNINEYLDIILAECDEVITDEEVEITKILNNSEIDDDKKEVYISYLQTKIKNLKSVEDVELWKWLIEQEMVIDSREVILSYFIEFKLDIYLINYINSINLDFKLNYRKIKSEYGERTATDFFRAVIGCNELFNEKYELILSKFYRFYESFSNDNLNEDKMLILIKLKIIRISDSNLKFIRENYSNLLISFIALNIEKYAEEIISAENLNMVEMLSILDENVEDKYKIKLLEFATDAISISEKPYSDEVKRFILTNNFDEGDIQYIISNYSSEGDSTKDIIKQKIIIAVDEVIAEKHSISFELLEELLESTELSIKTKKELFTQTLPDLNSEETKELLKILRLDDFLGLFNRKRPKIEFNEINKRLLTIFKEKGWITKFDLDEKEPEFYRVIGRNVK